MELFQFFLVLLVPGLIGAFVYNKAICVNARINIAMALILDLLAFTIMITGLYYFKGICTVKELLIEFGCLSFTRKYILLNILIVIILSILWYFICKLFKRKCAKFNNRCR
jgi:hypothetical protein